MITGDTQEIVDKAAEIIKKLLVPIDVRALPCLGLALPLTCPVVWCPVFCEQEDKNLHKAKQLRELAQINGTAVIQKPCRICGRTEKGHNISNVPQLDIALACVDLVKELIICCVSVS